ncbi:MAG: homoserine dehydrogenase [Acidobacteria bacterium]|nr:homoserine dehydrogenase [Acidobacteriota bacterium]
MEPLRLALIGFGNVGQGFMRVLSKTQVRCVVAAIATKRNGCRLFRDHQPPSQLADWLQEPHETLTLEELVAHPHIDVVIETLPTDLDNPSNVMDIQTAALRAGKHVITANKGPAAHSYLALAELARENHVIYGVEATVMSGTPAIQLIHALQGAQIKRLQGIFNGTSNFILSQMEGGSQYADALTEATRLGYAEPDPSADVDGLDIRAKLMILAQVAFGVSHTTQDIQIAGIRDLDQRLVAETVAAGKRLKLVGLLDPKSASVRLMSLPETDPLARISGATNGIAVTTELLGTVSLIGPGAGAEETGTALLVDLNRVLEVNHG